MESVIKNVWEVTIVNNEIECANRFFMKLELIKLLQLVPALVNVLFL